MIHGVMKSNKKITIGKLFVDGAYEGNDIFRFLAGNGVLLLCCMIPIIFDSMPILSK